MSEQRKQGSGEFPMHPIEDDSRAEDGITSDEVVVRELHGLYVGQLRPYELDAFERCVKRGTASRDYSNEVAALLGLSKVRFHG